jgi:hypothetical protein
LGFRRFLTTLLAPPNLLYVGWGKGALVAALVLTMLTYLCLNTWLLGRIERAYERMTLPGLASATSVGEAADRVLDLLQTDQKTREALRGWLRDALVLNQPAPKQLETLFITAAGGADSEEERKACGQVLRELIVGRRHNWHVFWLTPPSIPTGEDVVKAVEERVGGNWRKTLDQQDHPAARRAILARFSNRLIARINERSRALNLFSGWVQWVTIFLFWLILLTLVRRYLVLRRLKREVALPRPSQDWLDMLTDDRYRGQPWPTEEAWYRDGFERLRKALENDVYGTFAFLLGLLPSAGFIGTVQGIGSALLAASGLFSQQERERTVGEITRHLGFAFDATFIALLLGAVGGALAIIYRLVEQERLRRWEALLVRLRTVPEVLPAPAVQASRVPAPAPGAAVLWVSCPKCGHRHGCKPENRGKSFPCANCSEVIRAPEQAGASAAAPRR